MTNERQPTHEEKEYVTYVVEFEGPSPAVGANTEILGGKLVAVQFNDALKELEEILNQKDHPR